MLDTIYTKFKDSIGIKLWDSRHRSIYKYIYDTLDIRRKKKIAFLHKYKWPIEHTFKVIPNYKWGDKGEPIDSIRGWHINRYYRDVRNRIISSKDYLYDERREQDSSLTDNSTWRIYNFAYDNSDHITEARVQANNWAKDENGIYWGATTYEAHDLNVSCSNNNYYKFQYDDLDRMTKMIFYSDYTEGQENMRYSQEYFYLGGTSVVEKINTYTTGIENFGYITKNIEEHYDEWGNLTQRIDINDAGDAIRWRYFEYEYDQHHNWVTCNMYLQGTQEQAKEPTLITYRDIEYYENIER